MTLSPKESRVRLNLVLYFFYLSRSSTNFINFSYQKSNQKILNNYCAKYNRGKIRSLQSLQGIRNPRDVSSSSIKKFIVLSIISNSISSSIHSNSTVLFLVQNIFQIISPQLNPASCSRPAYSLKNMFTICNIWDQFPPLLHN